MTDTRETNSPPASNDSEGWWHSVHEGHYAHYHLEEIVAAIQDLGPSADRAVLNTLSQHLSQSLERILRRLVGYNHPNRGRDIIEAAHGRVIEAVLQPTSADGKALRVAFIARVALRVRSAIASEMRASGYNNLARYKVGASPNLSKQYDSTKKLDEALDVESFLQYVPDSRKRRAFRLVMANVPIHSNKSASIVKSIGISETTARTWIKEVREILRSIPSIQEILKERQNAANDTGMISAAS